ncbi:MAG: isochorismatase family protein [Gammaproteobacteria bacterium]|nr:isochorismatase family protein [Gammaproteobacteria bacterium]
MLRDNDALLVVDAQRDFLPGGALAVPGGNKVVPVLAAYIEAFARNGRPIFASRDWHPADHCSFQTSGGQWPPHCIADSRGAMIEPALQLPANTTIVDKATSTDQDAYSAFEGTALDSMLRNLGIRRLFIGGLATEYCVLNSALDALRLGYEVVLLTDAISAIDEAAGARAIEKLHRAHAEFMEAATVLNGQR